MVTARPNRPESVLSVREAAERLGISYPMLRRLVKQGKIAHVSIAGVKKIRPENLSAIARDVSPVADRPEGTVRP